MSHNEKESYMKRLQVSRNIITKELINENRKYLVTAWQKIALALCSLISLIIAVVKYMDKSSIETIAFVIVAVVCAVELFWIYHKTYKDALKIFDDDHDEVTYTLSFGDTAVTVHNCLTNENEKIEYKHIRKIGETKSTYTLLARYGEMVIIRKESLKNGIGELCRFLKSKETKIKKWPQ